MNAPRILWADDEIDLLRPHVMFLEKKGYDVTTVANGADAVDMVGDRAFDVVLLDEQMPGMDGLETLEAIKDVRPEVPVVMVTKSEEEQLMEEALGGQISDYLTKPVNPSQILLTIKRLLERQQLQRESVSQRYLQSFGEISQALHQPMEHADWTALYQKLIRYDMELSGDDGARDIFRDQFQDANRSFGQFIEENYFDWIAGVDDPPDDGRPILSHELVPEYVLPEVRSGDRPVIFFVIDCMRYDQWLEFEPLLRPHFSIQTDFHYSILPTATPYSRNSIFSGLLPRDLT
ncbi:MAG: response regulator, partial [Bacteroidetes bacterium]|nr:response regulator [Bacteroidota bacterium]